MSEKFTASNGVEVETDVHGCVTVTGLNSLRDESQALREFFLHERDQELGRWRMHPGHHRDWVAYPKSDEEVRVVNESSGSSYDYKRGEIQGTGTVISCAYFSANPLPKPAWHEAAEGEVWLLTFDGNDPAPVGVFDFDGVPHFSVPGGEDFSSHYGRITAGRRIWPEAVES